MFSLPALIAATQVPFVIFSVYCLPKQLGSVHPFQYRSLQRAEGCCVHGLGATIVVCLAPRQWSCIIQLSDKLITIVFWVLSKEELMLLLLP